MAQTISMSSVIYNPLALGVKYVCLVLCWSSVKDLKAVGLMPTGKLDAAARVWDDGPNHNKTLFTGLILMLVWDSVQLLKHNPVKR